LWVDEVIEVGIEFAAVSNVHAAPLQELGLFDHLLTGKVGRDFLVDF
jgi:hypothetical protein